MNMKKKIGCVLLSAMMSTCLLGQFSTAEQPTVEAASVLAFPTAEGYGKNATGGRGGAVYEVTTLNATGAGSLGEAINASGARTVVFRVSGTIEGSFNIKKGNITIAGQTAPGDGICIKGSISIGADDVIIRYLRVRPNPENCETDAIGGRYHKNIILDHISASWSSDEVMSLYHNDYTTIQWCIISEACEKAGLGHRFGGIWGNNYGTYHHNLIANNDSRNIRWASGSKYNDYRNNVIYNWGYQSSYGGGAVQNGVPGWDFSTINMVGNYYKPGPATKSDVKSRIVNPSNDGGVGSWYISGNIMEGSDTVTKDNWKGVDGSDYKKMSAPWDAMKINEETPQQAYESVLKSAGCSLMRDAIDSRIIEETRKGTASKGKNGIITVPADAGGWPKLNSAPAPKDSDHDGMPDDWEKSHNLNANDVSDGKKVSLSKEGYTNLEVYLNELAGDTQATVPVTTQPTQTTVTTASTTTTTTTTATTPSVVNPLSGRYIKDLKPNANAYPALWNIDSSVQIGDAIYTDRDGVNYTEIPQQLIGAEAIVTPCDAKQTESNLAVFTAAENITVYVALDDRVANVPGWLSGWNKTGLTVKNSQDIIYSLYSRNYDAGNTVELGTNGQSTGCTGYTVFVVPAETTPVQVIGDINMDGACNIADIILLKKWLLTEPNTAIADWKAGDMDGNGRLNAVDLTLLKRTLLSK